MADSLVELAPFPPGDVVVGRSGNPRRNIVSNDLRGGQIPRKAYALALE